MKKERYNWCQVAHVPGPKYKDEYKDLDKPKEKVHGEKEKKIIEALKTLEIVKRTLHEVLKA
jgi:hypothetical protein